MRGYEKLELHNNEDTVEINLPYEFDYIFLKRDGDYIYKKSVKEIKFENIDDRDCLFITSNQTVYFVFEFQVEEDVDCQKKISEDTILKTIQFYKNAKKVKIPYQYQVKLRRNYEDSLEIKKLLKRDEIPVPVLKILEEL